MNGSDSKKPALISLAEVEEKESEWLVPQYIPKGQISLLAGDGGSGKTSIWNALAAAISTGTKVFFDSVPDDFAKTEPRNVLYFSSEDSTEFILKRRLRLAGANEKNIFFVSLQDEAFNEIKFNNPIVEEFIKEANPALVIFDPIQSFIPQDVQMGQRNAMRNCLNPLIGLGEKYGCTFLIILHTDKRQGTYGRNRVADSADIWDIARSVLIAGTAKDNTRYLSHEKSNYGELGETVIFAIEEGVAKFVEHSNKKDKDFVLERDYEARDKPQRADAQQFIIEYLRNGKKPTKELDEAVQSAGISKRTLDRAKSELRNKKQLGSSNEGFGSNKVFYSYLLDQSLT